LQDKLSAKLWQFNKEALNDSKLNVIIEEGEEFWVEIADYKSANIMAGFFEFCPFIAKTKGKLILQDTFCHKSKGFFCEL